MRFLIAILLFPILGFAQDKYPKQEGVDVLNYSVSLVLNDSTDRIMGKVDVKYQAKETVKALLLDLFNEYEGKGMLVQGVSCHGQPLTYKHENNQISIELTTQMKSEKGALITVLYEGVPQDGLIISKNKFGDRTFFGDNWPNRAHHWFPCIDHPSEKATVDFKVTAPSHYSFIANGLPTGKTTTASGFKTTWFASKYALPTKVMVIGVAKFSISNCGDSTKIPQYAYVDPPEEENGFQDYCSAIEILEWFEQKIAPYPYDKLAHVQSKTRYGGMENASCIFYHENSIDGKKGSEYLFAHEIAHQWFGNSASEDDWHHVWLSEGFATYLTEVYKQETKGDSAFLAGMEAAGRRVFSYQKKYPDSKIIDTNFLDLNRLLSPMVYQKAAWMLHTLRAIVGDKIFWEGVRNYYKQYRYGNATSDLFQEEMEKVCHFSLDSFFDTWLHQSGVPEVKVKYKYKKKKKQLSVKLSQDKNHWFVVPVTFGYKPEIKEVMDGPKMKMVIKDARPPKNGLGFDWEHVILME